MTWDSSSPAATPPNGSSAGITALSNDTTGEIDWARSSRGPNPGETGTKQFWAYALGAVDTVKFPGSNQPAKLTQQDLIGIYTCSASTHKPAITNWKQIGGKSGAIVRYAPQAGSGTLSFFQTKLLGGHTVDQNCTHELGDPARRARRTWRDRDVEEERDLHVRLGPLECTAEPLRGGPPQRLEPRPPSVSPAKTAVIPEREERERDQEAVLRHSVRLQRALARRTTRPSFTSQTTWLERFVGVRPRRKRRSRIHLLRQGVRDDQAGRASSPWPSSRPAVSGSRARPAA